MRGVADGEGRRAAGGRNAQRAGLAGLVAEVHSGRQGGSWRKEVRAPGDLMSRRLWEDRPLGVARFCANRF